MEIWRGKFYPWWRRSARRQEQIKCQHPDLTETLTEAGSNKIFVCPDCGAVWNLW